MNITFVPPSLARPSPQSEDTPPRLAPKRVREPFLSVLLPRVLLVLVLAGATFVGMSQFSTPDVTPATASATQFSADRAFRDLATITQAPRPMGTPAHAAVEQYLLNRLTALGLRPHLTSMTATMSEQPGVVWAGRARQIVARIPGTANTGAILVAGHYDSVPTTAGAADCGACVATVLETARALKAGPPIKNDVILLLVDAEEHSTLGSKGFMDQHPWARDIRFALNIDSMGNHGPAVAYFASAGNDWLMNQYFGAAPYPLSYSFFLDPFTRINMGMDLKNYIRDGALGIDAANFRNPQVYHTELDNASALERGTLQQEGSNVLALVRHFGRLDLRHPSQGGDAVFFNVTSDWGIIYPADLALPLALLVSFIFTGALVLGYRSRKLTVGGLLAGFGVFLGACLSSMLVVGVVWWLVKQGTADYHVFMQDTAYNFDLYLLAFAALDIAVVAALYAAARMRFDQHDLELGAAELCVLLMLITSVLLPGMSYLFTWPTLASLLVLGWILFAPEQMCNSWARATALALSGALCLILVVPVVYFLFEFMGRMETTLSIPLVELALLPAVLLLALLLPHLEFLSGSQRRLIPVAALIVSLGFIAEGESTSGFDATHPRPDGVAYVQNADTKIATWISVGDRTDNWTQQFFPHSGHKTTFVALPSELPDLALPALQTQAPDAGLSAPRIAILSDRSSGGTRHLQLQVVSRRGAPNIELKLETTGRISQFSVDGRGVNVGTAGLQRPANLRLEYYGLPRSGARLALSLTWGRPLHITLTDRSNGLPTVPGMTIKPRPSNTMPAMFEMLDPTIITRSLILPA